MSQHLFAERGVNLRRIIGRAKDVGQLFLFLDYDGTIVRLRKTPRLAILSDRDRKLLLQLRNLRGTTLGIITGRSLRDIKTLVHMNKILLAANHGFEIEIGGKRWIHPAARALIRRFSGMARTIRQSLHHIPHILVENKQSTLSIHYRNVAPSNVDRVRAIVSACVRPDRRSIKTTNGKKVIEIRPNVAWGKGHAVRRILRHARLSKRPMVVYCGDDVTDEDAFRMLPDDAVTVHVGHGRESIARFSVRSVAELHKFLRIIESERSKATTNRMKSGHRQ